MTNPRTNPPFRAFLFDLDGTLVDSAPDISHAANAGLAALGLGPLPESVVRRFIGDGLDVLVRRSLHYARGLPPDDPPADSAAQALALEEARRFYLQHPSRETRVYPRAHAVLEALSARAALALVTNKPYAITLPLLDALDLRRFFPVVLGGDSLPQKKPDPAPVREALSRLGGPAPALFVGDAENDLLAGRGAGLAVALVSHGYTDRATLASLHPEHLFSSLEELLAL